MLSVKTIDIFNMYSKILSLRASPPIILMASYLFGSIRVISMLGYSFLMVDIASKASKLIPTTVYKDLNKFLPVFLSILVPPWIFDVLLDYPDNGYYLIYHSFPQCKDEFFVDQWRQVDHRNPLLFMLVLLFFASQTAVCNCFSTFYCIELGPRSWWGLFHIPRTSSPDGSRNLLVWCLWFFWWGDFHHKAGTPLVGLKR